MSHILEATYDNGVLKLDQPLPLKGQEKVRGTTGGADTAQRPTGDSNKSA